MPNATESYNTAAIARLPERFHCTECSRFAVRPADEIAEHGKVCSDCEWVAARIVTPEQPF